MQSAILDGLSKSTISLNDVSATCSTGNCTFDPHSTLGICAASSNVTSFLTVNDTVAIFNMSLTNGVAFNQSDLFGYYLNIKTLLNSSLGFPTATNPLVNIYIFEGNNYPGDKTNRP